ncbi:Efflux pump roqT, partial [Colletotrichum shisoi]
MFPSLCNVSGLTWRETGTAIPRITADFNSLQDAGLYRSASLVASTALQLPYGKAYAQFNVKWIYIGSLVIFEAGSVLCAAAPSSGALVAGRVVSGAGAAALYSGAINMLAMAAGPQRAPALFGIVSSMVGLASLVTDGQNSRNTSTAIPFMEKPFVKKARKMDPLGTALLIPALVSLLLALQWGGTEYPWSDGRVWGCLVCSGVLAALFVASLWVNGDDAVIPPRLLRDRSVLGGVLLIFGLSAALFTHVFFLPFYFQVVQGLSATASGLRILAYLGAMALAGVFAGGAMSSRGALSHHRPYAWVGTALFVVGAGLLHMLSVGSGLGMVVGFQLLSGVALGVAWQVPYVAVQRSKKLATRSGDAAIANAMIAFSNSFGAALGISIAQNVFATTLARGLADLPGLSSDQAHALARAGQAARLRDSEFVPPELLALVLQVFHHAITSTFTFAA